MKAIVTADAPSVIVGCECSGRVREALRRRGVNAWSCDIQAAEDGSEFHLYGDVFGFLDRAPNGRPWDGAIFHPECTYLSNSGVQWLDVDLASTPTSLNGFDRWLAMVEAAKFYRALRACPIPRKVLENPAMNPYAKKLVKPGPRQVVQPWHFGDEAFKATGFELINVPQLRKTNVLKPPKKETEPERHAAWSKVHRAGPTKDPADRKRFRSRIEPGIAEALADAMVRALTIEVAPA